VTLRAAVIGCGAMGSRYADDARIEGIYSHAAAYRALEATELVAVCDADPVRLVECASRWDVSGRYQDAASLLAESRPDVVSVCTPDSTHARIIQQAIETPGVRAVIAEKPLALSVADAAALLAEARRRGVIIAVNYMRRYSAGHRDVRSSLQAGAIGDIQRVSGLYTKGVRHNGTHWFDLLRFFAGNVAEVTATLGRGADEAVDPTLDVMLKLQTGAVAHLAGADANAYSVFELDLIGTTGRLRLVDSGHRLDSHTVIDSQHYSGYRSLDAGTSSVNDMRDTTLRLVEDVAACVRQGGVPVCSGDDGLAALEIAEAACESAVDRRPVGIISPAP
jgi:predicted dehydrogenase